MVIAFKLARGRMFFACKEDPKLMNESLCALINKDDGYYYTIDEPLVIEVVEEELKARNVEIPKDADKMQMLKMIRYVNIPVT